MRNLLIISVGVLSLISCDVEGVKTDKVELPERVADTLSIPQGKFELSDAKNLKEFKNGVQINWVERGEGKEIGTGDVVNINYEVWLEDSTLVESNMERGLKSFPFMVGFGMQTEGWDFALSNMKIGDSVEIYLPSELARGEKGYKERDMKTGTVREVIPPNSNLILIIRAVDEMKPVRTVDGNKVWLILENKNNQVLFDENNQIDFHCTVSTPTNVNYVNTFNNKPPFSLKLEDHGVVPGLKKALIDSKKGDRMYVYIPADQAYKNKGYQDLVKPNEPLFYNIYVMDVIKK